VTTYYSDDQVTLHHGHAVDVARTLDTGSADCVVTSPPYFGLRDYGVPGTDWPEVTYAPMADMPEVVVPAMTCPLGLEPSPTAYVAHLVLLFRELRRVLADDGTMWINLGDSFAANGVVTYNNTPNANRAGTSDAAAQSIKAGIERAHIRRSSDGIPPKNLLGVPWRVAFALQADGWILRNSVVWYAPNKMPESVTDRLSTKHEMVFMFAKRAKYWFDLDAIREPIETRDKNGSTLTAVRGMDRVDRTPRPNGQRQSGIVGAHGVGHTGGHINGRNPGDVWAINTQPFAAAHFAVMPRTLAERCIQAGCTPRRCTVCGHAPTKITEAGDLIRTPQPTQRRSGHVDIAATARSFVGETGSRGMPQRERIHTGWTDCGHDAYRAGTVLDPFSGSGTTGLAAARHGMRYIGIDLSREYLDLSLTHRLQNATLDFTEGTA